MGPRAWEHLDACKSGFGVRASLRGRAFQGLGIVQVRFFLVQRKGDLSDHQDLGVLALDACLP